MECDVVTTTRIREPGDVTGAVGQSGDQRLILIARAMVKHPSLLILDEPCLGLDDINRQLVLALVEKICAGAETTVLYVNHRPEDAIDGIGHHLSLKAPAVA